MTEPAGSVALVEQSEYGACGVTGVLFRVVIHGLRSGTTLGVQSREARATGTRRTLDVQADTRAPALCARLPLVNGTRAPGGLQRQTQDRNHIRRRDTAQRKDAPGTSRTERDRRPAGGTLHRQQPAQGLVTIYPGKMPGIRRPASARSPFFSGRSSLGERMRGD